VLSSRGPHLPLLFYTFALLQAARAQNRLQFLLKTADIFHHFAPEVKTTVKK